MFSERSGKIWMWIGIILFFVGVIFFLWHDLNFDKTQPINSQKFGEFGSFIGGLVGSIWAFAGVILFYVALKEQRKDMKINQDALNTQIKALEQQIDEFELQRRELELTREVFTEQSKTLKMQQFESTFFNSVSLFRNLVDGITYNEPPNPVKSMTTPGYQPAVYKGTYCFEIFYESYRNRYRDMLRDYITNDLQLEMKDSRNAEISIEKLSDISQNAYESFFSNFQSDLGHYFRTLYNIIRFVKEKNIENPKYYTNLIRAQLSTYEHLMLFYNCHSNYGNKRFKPLVDEFSLLNNMPQDMLIDQKHINFYRPKAYE